MAKRVPKANARTTQEDREAKIQEMLERAQRYQRQADRLRKAAKRLKSGTTGKKP